MTMERHPVSNFATRRGLAVMAAIGVVGAIIAWLVIDAREGGRQEENAAPSVPNVLVAGEARKSHDPRTEVPPGGGNDNGVGSGCSTINGIVETDLGEPLPRVVLDLRGPRLAKRTYSKTDNLGQFSFRGLEVGDYSIQLDYRSLPDGLVGPIEYRGQPKEAFAAYPGLISPTVHLTEGVEPKEVRVTIVGAARVVGAVVGRDGSGIRSAHVRLTYQPYQYHAYDCQTDHDGRFQFRGVLPGAYRLQVWLQKTARENCTPLLPRTLNLASGEFKDVGRLLAENHANRIAGRVVDQYSEGFSGLEVVCYPDGFDLGVVLGRATTSSSGSFTIEHLPCITLNLQIEPEARLRPMRDRAVAYPPKPIRVDPGKTSDTDVGTIRVTRSEPYVAQGRVLLPPVRGTRKPLKFSKFKLMELQGTLSLPQAAELVWPAMDVSRQEAMRRHDLRRRIQLDSGGQFRLTRDYPFRPVTLILYCIASEFPPVIKHLFPRPNGREQIELRFGY